MFDQYLTRCWTRPRWSSSPTKEAPSASPARFCPRRPCAAPPRAAQGPHTPANPARRPPHHLRLACQGAQGGTGCGHVLVWSRWSCPGHGRARPPLEPGSSIASESWSVPSHHDASRWAPSPFPLRLVASWNPYHHRQRLRLDPVSRRAGPAQIDRSGGRAHSTRG